jgi:hypothetical protein
MELEDIVNRVARSAARSMREPVPHDLNEPQALVLICIETRCESCGNVTKSHNPHMMVRYGARTDHTQSIKHTRAECEQFTHLPRETRTYHASSPFCPECF